MLLINTASNTNIIVHSKNNPPKLGLDNKMQLTTNFFGP
ncbi:hypothetical protein GMES_0599 [Paraglaciecola mesophila KMM 241]|uniref:Uncharacterized protein n=1 Tax=Paraglaciecola mesophila KMM 241 TaxID=1128912 RepID=K6ZHQ5_9ALTE|nr:hypothetical protein GMES_0599 [Paraglaciecola mesophila KMM 241]